MVAALSVLMLSINDTVMKIAVCVYCLVISVMGLRALNQRKRHLSVKNEIENLFRLTLSGWGAVFFMSSDLILAINKFVTPLPVEKILVMSTYVSSPTIL